MLLLPSLIYAFVSIGAMSVPRGPAFPSKPLRPFGFPTNLLLIIAQAIAKKVLAKTTWLAYNDQRYSARFARTVPVPVG